MHIQLLKPHTHDGQMLAPGDSLHLAVDLAQWLINLEVACACPSEVSVPAASPSTSIKRFTEEVSL
ncbi:MAG TPA: hypothetical protein PKZ52_16710 [Cellvibrionaceae bacterium]|nr:hypothetical protein [Cellvibrionaceae bacterium]